MEAKTTESREARRKRILERGSDRLALITGRDSYPSSPLASEPHQLHAFSLPPSIFNQDRDSQPAIKGLEDEQEMPRTDSTNPSIRSTSLAARRLESQFAKREIQYDPTKTPPNEESKPPPPTIDTTKRPPPLPQAPSSQPPSTSQRKNPFTVKKISSSISSTENLRIRTSVIIALLVILSHLRIPILSSGFVRAIIATRPVFLVLLTDVTIVVARLFEKKQVSEKRDDDKKKEKPGDVCELGANLETGLLLYKALTALFMDCSLYLVVLICALSLLRGWY